MNVLNSSEFQNQADMDNALLHATEGGKQAVLIAGKKRYIISDVETAKDQLAAKIANQIVENPKFLEDVVNRLENETPREW